MRASPSYPASSAKTGTTAWQRFRAGLPSGVIRLRRSIARSVYLLMISPLLDMSCFSNLKVFGKARAGFPAPMIAYTQCFFRIIFADGIHQQKNACGFPDFKRLLVRYYEGEDFAVIRSFLKANCWRTF
jgi:hypothetical protein